MHRISYGLNPTPQSPIGSECVDAKGEILQLQATNTNTNTNTNVLTTSNI